MRKELSLAKAELEARGEALRQVRDEHDFFKKKSFTFLKEHLLNCGMTHV